TVVLIMNLFVNNLDLLPIFVVFKVKEDEEEVETKKGVKQDNKKKRKKKKKGVKEDVPVEKVPEDDESPMENNSEQEEIDFWMPSPGSRWDFDDGKDRWGSDTESGQDSDEGVQVGDDIAKTAADSERTKMNKTFPRKKKKRTPSTKSCIYVNNFL
ncbi:hypothetical protein MKW94_018285, partial [Papaver nudicaule]|nr:hypothetical protein [Papaver nudicaule]